MQLVASETECADISCGFRFAPHGGAAPAGHRMMPRTRSCPRTTHVSSFPGHDFGPGSHRTLHFSSLISLFSLPSHVHFLSHVPRFIAGPRCIVSTAPIRGRGAPKRRPGAACAPGLRAMTGTRGTTRGAAPPPSLEEARLPALHRGYFWFAQRIAACGIPFGLVPASCSLLFPASGEQVRAQDLPHGSYRPEGPLCDLPGPARSRDKPGQPRPRSALQERLRKAPLKSEAGCESL